MIKPTIINILGQPNGIVDLKKGFDKAKTEMFLKTFIFQFNIVIY